MAGVECRGVDREQRLKQLRQLLGQVQASVSKGLPRHQQCNTCSMSLS